MERAGFLAHALLPIFEKRVARSEKMVRRALDIGPGYVACSWGKDSVAMVHLCQQVQPDIPVLFFADPDEEMIDNYAETAQRYCDKFPTNYETLHFAGDRVPEKLQASRLWEQYPVAFVGIRAEEAAGRRMQVRKQGELARYETGDKAGSWRSWPLAWWSYLDVWAYICHHDIPYLDSYDDPANADRRYSRSCNLVATGLNDGPKGAQFGRMAVMRERNPAYFNQLCQLYPEMARWT